MSGEFNTPAALSLEKELLLPMELEVGWTLLNQLNESFSSYTPSLLLGLEPVQSCLGVARVMSNYGF